LILRLIRAISTSLLVSCALAACGGGEGVTTTSPSTAADTASTTTSTGAIARATISGTPGITATVGSKYSFTPTGSDTDGGTLTYSITNAPSWATFNTQTGELYGTPTSVNLGATTGIVITVADGSATASLPAFSIDVIAAAATSGTAMVTWVAPTENTNGTALTDLAGYYVYYGTDASSLSQTIQVSNAAALTYEVTGLAAGNTWYFAVSAYTTAGEQSALSAVSSKTL
jgi:Putative Ig domain